MLLIRELVQVDQVPKNHPRAIKTYTGFKKVQKLRFELLAFFSKRVKKASGTHFLVQGTGPR